MEGCVQIDAGVFEEHDGVVGSASLEHIDVFDGVLRVGFDEVGE